MNFILFDGTVRNALLPFTYTRPVADIRIGILTIREKWEKYLGATTTTVTEEYLSDKYPMVEMENNVFINASILPNETLVEEIQNLSKNQAIFKNEELIAFFTTENQEEVNFESYEKIQFSKDCVQIQHTYDIFSKNAKAIEDDFKLITQGRISQPIPKEVQCICPENIFIEEGASVLFSTLNASKGVIYIGKNAQIMEGCNIRGTFALGKNAILKMGAKIYGGTTLGPYCKIGGEVNNSVIFGYSSKGHSGYLGNSVLGEWCNLGADTNSSNLKNNYSEVRLWNYENDTFQKTGLQFCGLLMGDHSKTAINTMFNTGTVVGIAANIYGSDFPRNFIPSFSWGGSKRYREHTLKEFHKMAKLVTERREVLYDNEERKIIEHIFKETQRYRNFKKDFTS